MTLRNRLNVQLPLLLVVAVVSPDGVEVPNIHDRKYLGLPVEDCLLHRLPVPGQVERSLPGNLGTFPLGLDLLGLEVQEGVVISLLHPRLDEFKVVLVLAPGGTLRVEEETRVGVREFAVGVLQQFYLLHLIMK